MVEVISTAFIVTGFLAIVSYATWLLVKRLKAKESPSRSVREWLKNVLEGTWGL